MTDELDKHITEGRARAIAVAAVQQMHGLVLDAVRKEFQTMFDEKLGQLVQESAMKWFTKLLDDRGETPDQQIRRIAGEVARDVMSGARLTL